MNSDHCDLIVAGSAPGGATTAARVAGTCKRVLLLEEGTSRAVTQRSVAQPHSGYCLPTRRGSHSNGMAPAGR